MPILPGLLPAPLPRLPSVEHVRETRGSKRSFALGFTITALDPTLIATWTAAVAVLHSTGPIPVRPRLALPFALGVSWGIAAWFGLLIALLQHHRQLLSKRRMSQLVLVLGILTDGAGDLDRREHGAAALVSCR
ncbi:MAG: hypothetical protein RBU45_04200 [Myxococcota bacterium]|nr:hypothetical protein [Myxococcota bacterium]